MEDVLRWRCVGGRSSASMMRAGYGRAGECSCLTLWLGQVTLYETGEEWDLVWACVVRSIWNNVRNGLSTVPGPILFNWCGCLLHYGQKEVGLKVLDSRNGRKCKGVVSNGAAEADVNENREEGQSQRQGSGVIRLQRAWWLKTIPPLPRMLEVGISC